ncbi:MAG TPA: hypothetical protein VK427_21370 [Kofleriaceae bacterium]|nr:hypothetical protein [Kofleriaceae bacterium]
MATTHNIDHWHDNAGIRWLLPMIAVMAFVILGLLAMVTYPYVST